MKTWRVDSAKGRPYMSVKIQPKRILVGAGILALCVGVIVVGVAGIALARYQAAAHNGHIALTQPTPTPSSYGVTTATCDAPGKPACPTPDPGWKPYNADTPGSILAAIKQTWIFHVDLNDGGDHVQDLSHLGAPFMVRGLGSVGKILPDYYVLAIMDTYGHITDVGMFEVNAAHTALHFAAITSHDERYPIVRQTSSAAIAALQLQRHEALKSAAKPYLVYLDIDATMLETGQAVWNAGGGPMEPLWLLPGADGKVYVYGNDGKVYAESEIPLSA